LIRAAQTIFEQEITLQYYFTALVNDYFGTNQVSLFTWWFNASAERVRTTICGHTLAIAETAAALTGDATSIPLTNIVGTFPQSGAGYVEHERIDYTGFNGSALTGVDRGQYGGPWAHDIGTEVREAPSTIGAETGIALENAAGSSYTANQVNLVASWASPIYQLSLPGSARVVIDFHNVGTARLPLSIEAIQTQVCAGGIAAVRDAYQGIYWTLDGGALRSYYDVTHPGPFSATLPSLGAAVLLRPPHSTRLSVVGQNGTRIVYMTSFAEGQEGTWSDMATLLASANIRAACASEDGGLIYLVAEHAGAVRMLHARPDSTGTQFNVSTIATPTELANVSPGSYMVEQFGKLCIVAQGASGIEYLTSRDGGATWQ